MKKTNTHVPKIAITNAKNALPHRVELGMNSIAIKIPSSAEEIVAPVVGETNLFMQSCCIIKPATLIPMPVHKIASRRGRREISKIRSCSLFPSNNSESCISITPINSETTDRTANRNASSTVDRLFEIKLTSI